MTNTMKIKIEMYRHTYELHVDEVGFFQIFEDDARMPVSVGTCYDSVIGPDDFILRIEEGEQLDGAILDALEIGLNALKAGRAR